MKISRHPLVPVTMMCRRIDNGCTKGICLPWRFVGLLNCLGEVDYCVQPVKTSRWSSVSENTYHKTETCNQQQNYRPYYWQSNSGKPLIEALTIKGGLVYGESHKSPVLYPPWHSTHLTAMTHWHNNGVRPILADPRHQIKKLMNPINLYATVSCWMW